VCVIEGVRRTIGRRLGIPCRRRSTHTGTCGARYLLENARLRAELRVSAAALEASRRRIAAAADQERRRIERDLHDGAQQRLIALRIKLHQLEDLATDHAPLVAQELAVVGTAVEAALDEIRDLAHGIYPSRLHDSGCPAPSDPPGGRCRSGSI
jgi:signal transduction histidine kinase